MTPRRPSSSSRKFRGGGQRPPEPAADRLRVVGGESGGRAEGDGGGAGGGQEAGGPGVRVGVEEAGPLGGGEVQHREQPAGQVALFPGALSDDPRERGA